MEEKKWTEGKNRRKNKILLRMRREAEGRGGEWKNEKNETSCTDTNYLLWMLIIIYISKLGQ